MLLNRSIYHKNSKALSQNFMGTSMNKLTLNLNLRSLNSQIYASINFFRLYLINVKVFLFNILNNYISSFLLFYFQYHQEVGYITVR